MKIQSIIVFILTAILSLQCSKTRDDIAGIWEGNLKLPGFESRIVFTIEIHDNNYSGIFSKPDESDNEFIIDKISFENKSIHVSINAIQGDFRGNFDFEKNLFKGIWSQGKFQQSIVLNKISRVYKTPRPQTPLPPFPYNSQYISFENKQDNITLSGSLSWPSTGNDFTTIILIQGGGSHDRDYTIFRHQPFLVLSDFLTKQGFAVLRWDERGVGNSTGNGMSATSADFAKDVLSAIDFLKKSPLFKTNNIGLIGHSEGGNVASETAKMNRDVSFVILLGCPGLPGDQYQCQFEESTARAMGLSDESIEKRIILQRKILEIVFEEPNNDTVEMKLKTLFKTLNPNFTDERLNQAIARFLSPWFQHNAKYDPEKTLLQVNCPILAIYGEKDLHVPPEGNVEVIQKVINKTNCRQSKVVVLPNLNHFFQNNVKNIPFRYGEFEETISPVVLELILAWIPRSVAVLRNGTNGLG